MRRAYVGLLLACVVLLAGCSGVSLSGDRVELDAGQTVVAETAASDAGYELREAGTEELNETVSPGGRDVRVVVRNYVAVYEKTGGPDDRSVASVGVVTMPDASIAGQHLNPLVRMNETELVAQFATETGGSVEFERRGNYTVETLGGETEVTVYETRPEGGGDQVAYVHLVRTSPAGTDDAVLAYATYPEAADRMEREHVENMLSSLEYTPPEDDVA